MYIYIYIKEKRIEFKEKMEKEIHRVIEKLTKKEEEITRTCCFQECNLEIYLWGNDASPLNDGRCCDECYFFKVLPIQVVEGEKYFHKQKLN